MTKIDNRSRRTHGAEGGGRHHIHFFGNLFGRGRERHLRNFFGGKHHGFTPTNFFINFFVRFLNTHIV